MICPSCDKDYPVKDFMENICYKCLYKLKASKVKRRPNITEKKCKNCEKIYTPTGKYMQIYCTEKCGKKYYRRTHQVKYGNMTKISTAI